MRCENIAINEFKNTTIYSIHGFWRVLLFNKTPQSHMNEGRIKEISIKKINERRPIIAKHLELIRVQ